MRILRFWQFNRPWRTEIPDEPVQGIIALQVFAVMVPWDGEDWSMIKFIRLVELFIIFQYLTIKMAILTLTKQVPFATIGSLQGRDFDGRSRTRQSGPSG